MKRIILILLLAIVLGACAQSKMMSKNYNIVYVDSYLGKENGCFVKHLIIGDRPIEVHVNELKRKNGRFSFKGTVMDKVCHEGVPYPTLYLVETDSSRYIIVSELCIGDESGNFECIINSDYPKECAPHILIDAIGYHGTVYAIMSEVHENQMYEVIR